MSEAASNPTPSREQHTPAFTFDDATAGSAHDAPHGVKVPPVPPVPSVPDNGTPRPEEAYRHVFSLVAVYPNGSGSIIPNVPAAELHARVAELERGGALVVPQYVGRES